MNTSQLKNYAPRACKEFIEAIKVLCSGILDKPIQSSAVILGVESCCDD